MTWGRVGIALAWAAGLGVLLAFVTGEDRVVSIEIWLAGFSCWLALAVLLQLMQALPVGGRRFLGLWPRPRSKKSHTIDQRPRELKALEGLLLRARDNERAIVQLRPRLISLAAHFLPVHHGIDPNREPGRAADLFGNVAWLIEPDGPVRSPSLAEIDQFVTTLINEPNPVAAPAAVQISNAGATR